MNPALVVDVVLAALILSSLIGGWRQGAMTTILSTVGILAGLVVGVGAVPFIAEVTQSQLLRLLFSLGVVMLLSALGNLAGTTLGTRLRGQLRLRSTQWWDSLIGALVQSGVVVLICWLVSIPLASGINAQLTEAITGSRILRMVNQYAPPSWSLIPDQLMVALDESGVPPLLSPFEEARVREVAPPAVAVATPEHVAQWRPSVIHIMGEAPACDRRLMGSGFVFAPDYVLTNAHVVAGTDAVQLDTVLGTKQAEVVYFNPEEDIAVVYTPGLGIAPLAWADEPAETGDDALVLGFPASGPFEAATARVADRIRISGPSIYSTGRVERESYTVRGTIREGNSGGPLLSADGRVLGMVFGASRDTAGMGFALTAAEIHAHVGPVAQLTTPVDTQQCV